MTTPWPVVLTALAAATAWACGGSHILAAWVAVAVQPAVWAYVADAKDLVGMFAKCRHTGRRHPLAAALLWPWTTFMYGCAFAESLLQHRRGADGSTYDVVQVVIEDTVTIMAGSILSMHEVDPCRTFLVDLQAELVPPPNFCAAGRYAYCGSVQGVLQGPRALAQVVRDCLTCVRTNTNTRSHGLVDTIFVGGLFGNSKAVAGVVAALVMEIMQPSMKECGPVLQEALLSVDVDVNDQVVRALWTAVRNVLAEERRGIFPGRLTVKLPNPVRLELELDVTVTVKDSDTDDLDRDRDADADADTDTDRDAEVCVRSLSSVPRVEDDARFLGLDEEKELQDLATMTASETFSVVAVTGLDGSHTFQTWAPVEA